jgi:hypothetical protein
MQLAEQLHLPLTIFRLGGECLSHSSLMFLQLHVQTCSQRPATPAHVHDMPALKNVQKVPC